MEKTHLRNKERVINFSGAAAGQWKEGGNIFARVLSLASTSSGVHRSPFTVHHHLMSPLLPRRNGLNRGRVFAFFQHCSKIKRHDSRVNERRYDTRTLSNFRASGLVVSITDQRLAVESLAMVRLHSVHATVWNVATVWPRRPCSTCCSSTLPRASDCETSIYVQISGNGKRGRLIIFAHRCIRHLFVHKYLTVSVLPGLFQY